MSLIITASVLASVLAAMASTFAVPRIIRIAMAIRAMDYPGGRRLHDEAIPRLGGVAIVIGIAAGAIYPNLLLWRQWGDNVAPSDMLVLLVGTMLVFLIGVAEDGLGVTPLSRLLVQILAALIVTQTGWCLSNVYVPFWGDVPVGLLGSFITILWIVGVTNALNLLDGLDGLAGGVAVIIATTLLILACIQGNILLAIVAASIVGACLGFLRHNWAPARIYMGDSGSLTLGFLLAVTSLHASIKQAATVAILVPLLALGLPVIDTLLVMAVRFVQKPQGSNVRRFARVFQADRNHLHHLIEHIAPERKRIVLVIYSLAASFCAMALIVSVSHSGTLGIALVLVEVAVVFLMRTIGGKARTISLKQRQELREGFFADRTSIP